MYNLLLAVNTVTVVLIALGTLILGGIVGFWIFNAFASKKLNKNKTVALKIIEDAYAEAKAIKKEALLEAKEESSKIKEETTKELSIKYGNNTDASVVNLSLISNSIYVIVFPNGLPTKS